MTKPETYQIEVKKRIDLECDFIQTALFDLRELKDVNDITRKRAFNVLSAIMDSVTFLNHCYRFL